MNGWLVTSATPAMIAIDRQPLMKLKSASTMVESWRAVSRVRRSRLASPSTTV